MLLASFITVSEAQVPIIQVQPTNVVVPVGGAASFSVTVSGTGPLTYQWQFNGTDLPNGMITTVAGNGAPGDSGDGGPASQADLFYPSGVAADSSGNLFIADEQNDRVRQVGSNGMITTVAGTGRPGYSGDGGPATQAELDCPAGAAVDASGNLFIADAFNQRIRQVGSNGMITTVAGTGTQGYAGDGGPATQAELDCPVGVAVDTVGNLFIADAANQRIREVGTNGMITTVAGTGTQGYAGDGGPATQAGLDYPQGVAVDASGNLFIADAFNQRIREVGTNGMITTVAGTGTQGYAGDGGPATNAELYTPFGVTVDASGNLFIADGSNERIRKVGTNGMITTVAGNGTPGDSGDGGPASQAELDYPAGVAVDASGSLFIADQRNNRIREVVFPGPTLVLANVRGANAGAYDVVVSNLYGSVTSSVVTLQLPFPPAFVTQPQSQGVALGSNATLSVVATGPAPLGYQWYWDGAPLQGQTNTTLPILAATLTNAGSYFVVVTNLYGSIKSAVAVVTVGIGPGITAQPMSQTNLVQSTASFSVSVSGTGPFTYQWQFKGTNLPNVGLPGPTLVLANVSGANAGAYEVVVSSPYGSVTSSVVTLQVLLPPAFVTQPQSQGVALGSNATLSVVATGTAPLDYQWYWDGAPLQGQTNTTLPILAATLTNAGSYFVVVTNLYGAATSSIVTLVLNVVRYVNVNNFHPTPPYTNWPTAATNIQDALDAAAAGDQIVATNGTYAWGSRVDPDYGDPTCVVVDKSLILSSVNGPGVTVINGGGAVRCLYLTNDAVMVGFTLTNGSGTDCGGGVYCEFTNAVLTNCVLSGNSAGSGGGGAASGGTLNNCALTGNSAYDGGGAYVARSTTAR